MKKWLKEKWAKMKSWVVAMLVAIGLVAAPFTMAEDITLAWTNPTSYTDGSPMPIEELAEVRLYKQSFPLGTNLETVTRDYVFHDSVSDVASETFTDLNQADGIHCYVGTAVSVMGIESFYSNEKCVVVDARRPNPIENLDVVTGNAP